MPQIIDRNRTDVDAIVVGSGATGGWAAKQLTEAGLRVAVLEAGAKVTEADFSEHTQPWEVKYRFLSKEFMKERPLQRRNYACRETNYKWFVNDVENPYTTPEGKPFDWFRLRVLGGRSLVWGRGAFRLSDLDFKAASRDGYGEDWPISEAEMRPHYETVEKYIGVSGTSEGLPQLPDSIFQPALPMYCGERRLKAAVWNKFRRVVTEGRSAVLTRPLNGRAACHYCGPCEQGCVTHSYYSSPFTVLKAAQATGRLTLLTGAVVSHVTMDKQTGLATGVAYVERDTRAAKEIKAKIIVLSASTLESTRILLNSAPGGLANSSGALGHYLMDHLMVGVGGTTPLEKGESPWQGAPRSPNHIVLARFRNVKETETNGFLRGYHITGGCRPQFNMRAQGFGSELKRRIREEGYWSMRLGAFTECLPRYENYVEIDKNTVDAWGIPVLRIQMTWGENELAMRKDAYQQCAEMLESAGCKDIPPDRGTRSDPGVAIHEVGTARMGADPKKSVLNKYAQAWDVKNLFVTDGACYPTSACQNPTLNMMANTVRICEYIAEQAKTGAFG